MRVGIYNLYWNTRGGGERYAGAIAEVLSGSHEVELIGCEPVNLQELSASLALDLSRVKFTQWPTHEERENTARTADYDLFINSTFWSCMPSLAKRSAYVVFFPQALAPRWQAKLTGWLESRLDGTLAVAPREGFHGVEGGHCWSKESAVVQVQPRAFRRGRARLRFLPIGPLSLAESLLDVSAPETTWHVEGSELVIECQTTPARPIDVGLRCRTFSPPPHAPGEAADSRQLGVCLDLTQQRRMESARLVRLAGRVRRHRERNDGYFISTYDVLLAISRYTQGWIERRWGLPSELLPPQVNTDTFELAALADKKKVILTVGRFFAGAHSKKHLEMVRAFRRMCDRGEIPEGWEFHLVGHVHRNRRSHLDYYARLETLAQGYPIRLLPDLPFSELQREYHDASIYWHAAGWGESENRHPEKFEHFGLTTCEAMSSGCIPVVIAKAGQLEIVRDGHSGFLFHNERELAERTRRLIAGFGDTWIRDMRQAAARDARRYGREAFVKSLVSILERRDLVA
jgi:glycosyltransferase involved in cell wall biosynthesis